MCLAESLLRTLIPMCVAICLGGSMLLFARSKGNRSRRVLGAIMLVWGLMYAIRTSGIVAGFLNLMQTDVLNSFALIWGTFYLIILLLYPLEVLSPGWLTLRRTGVILTPYFLIVAIYYIGLGLYGQEMVRLDSLADFPVHAGAFDVWFRLIILFSGICYVVVLLWITYRCEARYHRWCRDNYANVEGMDVGWLRYYGVGLGMIGVVFLWLLFDGRMVCYIVHNIVAQVFCGFTLYKGLFHENPYEEGFFRQVRLTESDGDDKDETVLVHRTLRPGVNVGIEFRTGGKQGTTDTLDSRRLLAVDITPASDSVFLARLPEYARLVRKWFDESHPYFDKHFKLLDVRKVLPLNRTYLSRVFNEGIGMPFCDLVRKYRMRQARLLLCERTDLSIAEISEYCGFSSPTSFHRTFVTLHGGVTPGQYRAEKEKKR